MTIDNVNIYLPKLLTMDELRRITLGKTIRKARQGKDLTLEEVADKLQTSKQNIGRYEKGNYIKPDYELLGRLIKFLEIESESKLVINLENATSPIVTEATDETDLAAKFQRLADFYKKRADHYEKLLIEKGISLD